MSMKKKALESIAKACRPAAGFVIFLVLFGLPSLAAHAGSQSRSDSMETLDFKGSLNGRGLPAEWKLKVHRGEAGADMVEENGERVLHMKSTGSSFALEHDVDVRIDRYPYLIWTWKAVALPTKGDVRERSRDDQALQLLVGFKDGRVLSYVWDATAPEGTVVDRSLPWPLLIRIKVIVVDSGISDMGKWVTNRRNIYEDYKELFGKEPPPVEGVRVQMNTQHTRSSAEGFLREIVFSGETVLAASDISGSL
jgi:hypothetical protein